MKDNYSEDTYEAIIFDMDGVIINSKDHVEAFWIKKLDQYGIHIPEEKREERFHGRPARPTVNDLFAELDESTREQIIEQCAEYDVSVASYPMIPGVNAFISKCVETGIRVGLVTSALPGKVERMLTGLSLPSNPFEVMVTANLVENGKPDPECYLLAANKMKLNPEKILVFEDSQSGVRAASKAGTTVIGVNEQKYTNLLKKAGATLIQKDFTDTNIQNGRAGTLLSIILKHKNRSFRVSV